MRLKDVLIGQGIWSQYLEVGIGPDAEIFTKCPPLASVGTGAEVGIHPTLRVEQPGARGRARRHAGRPRRRRVARQRRQPARLRGPQRAAARQGQGQQRLVRDRAVHPPLRRDVLAGRRAAVRSGAEHQRHRRIRVHRPQLDGRDQPRSAGDRRPHHRAASSISRRPHAVPRHDVRADRRPLRSRQRASPTWSATSSRYRRRSWARWSTGSITPTRLRHGRSASAR